MCWPHIINALDLWTERILCLQRILCLLGFFQYQSPPWFGLGFLELNSMARVKNVFVLFFVFIRVPEHLMKSITWQTLQAVNFCHKHNVSLMIFFENSGSFPLAKFKALFKVHITLLWV